MLTSFQATGTDAGLNFDISLAPGKRVYCFIGENGVGKTNLAENLARTLFYSHSLLAADEGAGKYARFFKRKRVYESLKGLVLDMPNEVQVDGVKVKSPVTDQWRFTPLEHARQQSGFPRFDFPIVFIGARDRGYANNIRPENLQILGDTDTRFVDAFCRSLHACCRTGGPLETQSLSDWLNSRLIINPKFVVGEENRAFEVLQVLKLFQTLEPSMNDLVTHNPEGGYLFNIHFSEGQLWFAGTPIDKLPTGYVSLVRIFQEIVGGYGGWTGLLGERDLGNVEGVVFIDEIEAHLHPKWQALLLPLLRRSFPKTTFFVCTHSPLVASTTEEDEAYELDRSGKNVTARKLGNPREWYLADVYSQAFHVDLPVPGLTLSSPGASLTDLLERFSVDVKEHIRTRDEKFKLEAEELYVRLLPSLPPSDPRRRSLDSLRALIR